MEPEVVAAIITSIVSLVAALIATYVAVVGEKRLKLLEAEYERKAESAEFVAAKLDRLYVPVSMNLAATGKLFDRFNEADEDEKRAIEHELRAHNARIRECLMNASMYIEPDAPDEMIELLLEHLLQWEIVYKLKYEHKVYEGPVFAGIDKFGFRGFPRDMDVDGYFRRKMKELKERHHQRLRQEDGSEHPLPDINKNEPGDDTAELLRRRNTAA